jgi:hypothetical protein
MRTGRSRAIRAVFSHDEALRAPMYDACQKMSNDEVSPDTLITRAPRE